MENIYVVILCLFLILVYIFVSLRLEYPLNMTDEMKNNFYNLMERFDSMCQENDIEYFAVAGTLLGVIRHEGIIPWDDDIDVGMTEENLKKLKSIDLSKYGLYGYGLEKTNTGRIYDINNRKETRKNFAVFIDIFVMENKNGKYEYCNPEANKEWPKEYVKEEELRPLLRKKFGPIYINTIKDIKSYAERVWGKNWKEPVFKGIKKYLYALF